MGEGEITLEENYGGFFIEGKDGEKIYLHCWENVNNPKGIIQIFHGMAEHGKRYERFAKYMNSYGFVVYADDHRGHGQTAGGIENVGYIGKDGFNNIVEDEHIVGGLIREKNPELPLVILGHSFGSFVAQEYMIRYGNEINGVILSGSAAIEGFLVRLGYTLAAIERFIWGEKKRSYLLDKLTFGSYNKRIKGENLSKFAWLTTDMEEVHKYEEDPFCGGVFTTGFYYYFFRALLNLYKKERLQNIPKDLPILIISGEEDPVGEYGVLVRRLYEIYKDSGNILVDIKIYPSKRHEILNEINREEVFEDILVWLKEKVEDNFS